MSSIKNKVFFTGDFKKLIPLGYKRNKYYANNYIGYDLQSKKYDTMSLILIWKAGKDLYLSDCKNEFQVALFNLLKTNTIESCRVFYEKNYSPICFKIKNDIATPVSFEEYCDYNTWKKYTFVRNNLNSLTEEEKTEKIEKNKNFYKDVDDFLNNNFNFDKYQSFLETRNSEYLLINEEMLTAFKFLIDENMINIKF